MESSDNVCQLCHEHIEIFAIGSCDHPICYKCSTRMRALCEQFYCPICRGDLPEVFFLKSREKFSEMPMRKFIQNRKLKILFEDEPIRVLFEKLMENRCKKCPDRFPETNFKKLSNHMRRTHTLFYCDLCLVLKIFTSERKVYNRHDLASHRRVGDKDDTSYKGHPLCQFCEERYLDKDELYKHLRKDHFFCHFCESLGSQEFYDDYPALRDHFHTKHYLCEEGECADAQFTNAFRSDIDLKSHQAHEHSKAQTKLQSRQERTLNIDINFVPRPNSRSQRGSREPRCVTGSREPRSDDVEDGRRSAPPRHQGSRGGQGGRYNNNNTLYRSGELNNREKQDIDRAMQASLSTMNDADMKKEKSKTIIESSSSEEEFADTVENFPILGVKTTDPVDNYPALVKSQATVTTGMTTPSTSSATDMKTSLADRCAMSNSMSVQHGVLNDFPNLSTTTRNGPKTVIPPKGRGTNFKGSRVKSAFTASKTEDDFPGLPSSNKSRKTTQGSWTQPEKPTVVKDILPSKHARKTVTNQWSDITSYDGNDFPSLGAPSNAAHNGKWFKSIKLPSSDYVPAKTIDETSNNVEISTKDVLDRFSPVNVPDSPKAKTKKKKKKDKLSELKAESIASSTTLKGNSSLDDIASLLMTSSIKEEKLGISKEVSSKLESKPDRSNGIPKEMNSKLESKPDRSKGKPKEVHSKLESKPDRSKGIPKEVHSKLESKPDRSKGKPKEVHSKLESKPDRSKAKTKVDKIEKKMEIEEEEVKTEKLIIHVSEVEEIVKPIPVKFTIANEEFPTLGTVSPPKKPPPGFKKDREPAQATAPPGFVKPVGNKPPPGFGSPGTNEVDQNEKVVPILSDLANFSYSQPNEFQNRNRALIGIIQSICVDDSMQFADFKTLSGEFRRSEISASQYYYRCEEVLGKDNFTNIFPELLALLPDIGKQQDLLKVFMQSEGMMKDDGVLKISGKCKNAEGAWTRTESDFLICQTCRQVLVRKDYNAHVPLHNLDSDFPSLSDGMGPGQKTGISGTWVKAK